MQKIPDVRGHRRQVLLELPPGHTDDPPACNLEPPVPGTVSLEGSDVEVVRATVELDDQSLLTPDAVALVPVALRLYPDVSL